MCRTDAPSCWAIQYATRLHLGPGKGPCRVHHRRRQGGLAISNGRLLNLEDGFVGFWYWNYAQGNQKRDMTLPGLELVRRLLLHVLPRGFVRILRYGLLSNRQRCEILPRAGSSLRIRS